MYKCRCDRVKVLHNVPDVGIETLDCGGGVLVVEARTWIKFMKDKSNAIPLVVFVVAFMICISFEM